MAEKRMYFSLICEKYRGMDLIQSDVLMDDVLTLPEFFRDTKQTFEQYASYCIAHDIPSKGYSFSYYMIGCKIPQTIKHVYTASQWVINNSSDPDYYCCISEG